MSPLVSNLKIKTENHKKGFTLVELLVVMAILGILTVITLANFRTSQIKGRDAQRKSDLRQIANALEAYFNDHSQYPDATATGGKINACGCDGGPLSCNWEDDSGQREFCDKNNTVYMSKIPGDPLGEEQTYCYYSENNLYRLYAKLENKNDPDFLPSDAAKSCGANYNFGIASSNTQP
jgi:general secretion pathway protein G